MREIHLYDLHWIAGLLEGEGSFHIGNRHQGRRGNVRVSMSSTDRDILERLVAVTGCGQIYIQRDKRPTSKQCWAWQVTREAEAVKLMDSLYYIMGDRRQVQIQTCLDHYASRPIPKCAMAKVGEKYCPTGDHYIALDAFSLNNPRCRACQRQYAKGYLEDLDFFAKK